MPIISKLQLGSLQISHQDQKNGSIEQLHPVSLRKFYIPFSQNTDFQVPLMSKWIQCAQKKRKQTNHTQDIKAHVNLYRVSFGTHLGNIHSPLLYNSMEPGKGKQCL